MPRTKVSKKKIQIMQKIKNVININVNLSTSKKGRGRPQKQGNDTSQNRQTRQPLGYNPGPSMMAPPQILVSQTTTR
jgi:hypothetical protein